jgi:hypothetical protein
METYLTEMDGNHRYLVKVVRSDSHVCASGNFSTLGMAHGWIDRRRSERIASAANK